MKKVSVILSSVLLLGLLAGCGSSNEGNKEANKATNAPTQTENKTNAPAAEGKYQDGVYFAQGETDKESGWRPFVKLTVAGGIITEAKWNATSATVPVDKVTFSEEGKYGMKAGGAQSEWHEQAAAVEKYLIEKQDPKDITLDQGKTDAISGVSMHVSDFFTLADAALTAGPIQVGPYKDGNYHAEGAAFDEKSGWKETADLVIAAGKIVNVDFSGVNAKGEDKKQNSIDGKYGMKAGGAQSEWHEQAALAEQYLLDKQDPASLTFNEEGKTDAISGVSIHLKSYYDLAAQALEQAK